MTRSEKQVFWKTHIEGWRSSGKSQKAYCEEQSISLVRFGYWRKRFVKPGKLIPVKMPSSAPSAKLFLPNGIRIEVPLNAIAQVVAALKEAA